MYSFLIVKQYWLNPVSLKVYQPLQTVSITELNDPLRHRTLYSVSGSADARCLYSLFLMMCSKHHSGEHFSPSSATIIHSQTWSAYARGCLPLFVIVTLIIKIKSCFKMCNVMIVRRLFSLIEASLQVYV